MERAAFGVGSNVAALALFAGKQMVDGGLTALMTGRDNVVRPTAIGMRAERGLPTARLPLT